MPRTIHTVATQRTKVHRGERATIRPKVIGTPKEAAPIIPKQRLTGTTRRRIIANRTMSWATRKSRPAKTKRWAQWMDNKWLRDTNSSLIRHQISTTIKHLAKVEVNRPNQKHRNPILRPPTRAAVKNQTRESLEQTMHTTPTKLKDRALVNKENVILQPLRTINNKTKGLRSNTSQQMLVFNSSKWA